MAITQQEILDQLDKLKNKPRPYLHPSEHTTFMPNAIPGVNKGADRSVFTAMMEATLDKSNSRTLTEMVKHQNRNAYSQMLQQQRALGRAQRGLAGARNSSGGIIGTNNIVNGRVTSQQLKGGGHYGPARGIGVGRNLAHFDWNGRRPGGGLTLNASVGNRFVGFLKALAATGYKIQSVGTYANRNIAGTGTKSLHAYGLAMDINPSQNPVTYGRPITNLPKGVGRLAAKYGLAWGGAWRGSKKDTMHFSVPYGGRK